MSLIVLAIFFREFFTSHFNLVAGNAGDNRFIIAILEHWRAVLHGQAHFRSPNFFWPEQGVLGYSEPLFLFSIPYIVGRAAGLDAYIAFEVTLIVFKAIGFFSMLWLLHSYVRLSRSVALIGSVLFTLSNLYYLSIPHAQLMAVVFVPLLASLACAAWQAGGRKQKLLAYVCAGTLGALQAGVLFTSFYIGWFTILATGLAIISAFLLHVLRTRTVLTPGEWIRSAGKRGWILAVAAFTFSISMVPFVVTFLPTLGRTGGRSFQENLTFTAHPIDIMNVGESNLMWGGIFNTIVMHLSHHAMVIGEVQMGWPALTLSVIAAGIFLSFRWKLSPTNWISEHAQKRFLITVLSMSFIFGWMLSVKVGEQSLWWLVFRFVPGGSAIRVPARFNIVLNLFVVVLTCLILDLLKERGRAGRIIFWCMSLLLIAEQINAVPVHLIERDRENAILLRPRRPPSACGSFFLTFPATRERPFYANQIDAMLIARMNNVPTIDGYSGWVPDGWHLDGFDQNYLQEVRFWVTRNHMTAGLCGLDLRNGSWSPINFTTMPYLPGSAIDFHQGGDGYVYETQGWGIAEQGGTWALGDHSSLLLSLPEAPTTDLLFTLSAHAFLPPQRTHFRETLRVNGTDVLDWSILEPHVEKRIRLPLSLIRSRSLHIEFVNHDPLSPSESGVSTDSRKLGLALEAIKLVPVSAQSDYLLGSDIDFTWGGNAFLYETEGWGPAEDGGSWTLGGHSVLRVKLPQKSYGNFFLTVRAHALICPQRPRFQESLRVNDVPIAAWSITKEQFEERIHLPQAVVHSGLLQIEFVDHDPKSPAELGLSKDNRKLGFAIENLKLDLGAGLNAVLNHSR